MRTPAQREQHRLAMQAYRQQHPERIKTAREKWYRLHPEYVAPSYPQLQQVWNKAHPYRNDQIRHGGLRLAVLRRDHYKCQLCGMTNQQHQDRFGVSITVDHKQGGGRYAVVKQHTLENMWTLCLRCHGGKDGKLAWSYIKGRR